MSQYKDLLKQREELDAQIKAAREREVSVAVASARQLIAEFELTHDDIFPSSSKRVARTGAKVEPKYRDAATGQTWTGRGKPPKWIADKDRELFAI